MRLGIGGCQVMKKRLSHQEQGLVRQRLSLDQAQRTPEMARRPAASVRLDPAGREL